MTRLRVLVVDDDSDVCQVVSWSLENMAACASAHDLDSALRHLEASTFDLVLIDITLRGESGLTLLDDIRERWPGTATSMISGTDDLDVAREALGRGALAYLVKPFRVNDLRIHVASTCAANKRLRVDQSSPRARIIGALQSMLAGDATVTCAVIEFQQLPLVSSRGSEAREELATRLAQADLRLVDLRVLGMLDNASFVLAGRCDPTLSTSEAALLVREAVDATADVSPATGQLALRFVVGVSAGNGDMETLLTEAEASARSALEQHLQVVAFTAALGEAAREELELLSDLTHAIARREIEVVYQPQFLITSKRMIGVEALARWRHPTRGNIPPSTFVPMAERNGLVTRLGEHVLQAACRDAAGLESVQTKGPRFSVNVSVAQLREPHFVDGVVAALAHAHLPPWRLCLEVTESLSLDEKGDLLSRFEQLAALGIRWSLDDFGTGFSTFETLGDFPWDEIKVDSALTAQVERHSGREILRSIVAMASRLNVDVVAEGVETPRQLEILEGLGFGTIQGFLLGCPVPIEQLRKSHSFDALQGVADDDGGLQRLAGP